MQVSIAYRTKQYDTMLDMRQQRTDPLYRVIDPAGGRASLSKGDRQNWPLFIAFLVGGSVLECSYYV